VSTDYLELKNNSSWLYGNPNGGCTKSNFKDCYLCLNEGGGGGNFPNVEIINRELLSNDTTKYFH
jgi:hypothetical protein